VVAFVGAGGKSSAILRVARELREAGVKVLAAPTTKMLVEEAEGVGPLVTSESGDDLPEKIAEKLAELGAASAGGATSSGERIVGIEPSLVPALAPKDGVTLVEADGSRRLPLKGTAEHEPALPDGVTLVVAVGGVRALGKPVDEEHVHRPEVFSTLTGVGHGHTITPAAFARALLAGLRDVSEGARRAALLADVRPGRSMAEASVIGHELWRGGVRKVVLTSLPGETPGRVWVL
jgi:probable selenium-dependent hydroxylase accessory protein YqeC